MEHGPTALVAILTPWPHNLHWTNQIHTKLNGQDVKKKKPKQITCFKHLETYTAAVYTIEQVDKSIRPTQNHFTFKHVWSGYHCYSA